jgi:uncharacterized membrane protein YkgB
MKSGIVECIVGFVLIMSITSYFESHTDSSLTFIMFFITLGFIFIHIGLSDLKND